MKRFYTTAPRQEVYYKTKFRGVYELDVAGNKLRQPGYYIPVDCDYLAFGGENHPCCYPVLPMINAFTEAGEEIEVIVLTAPMEKCSENLAHLTDEVQDLCAAKDVRFHMTEFPIPLDETIGTQLDDFERIISLLCEGDTIYLDMTYGSKPATYMLLLTMNYAHRAMKNVYVDAVVYGGMIWDNDGNPQGKRIYDCTKLFMMDQIIAALGEQNMENPAAAIRGILSFEPNEEI